MKRKVEVKAKRDDMYVGSLESDTKLFKAFPKGSVVLLKPDHSNARSDMLLGTLRKQWADKKKAPLLSFPGAPADAKGIEVNPLGMVGTLKDKMAEALGLPPAAIELRLRDGNPADAKIRVSTFFDSWES